jgi:hypothetical protein
MVGARDWDGDGELVIRLVYVHRRRLDRGLFRHHGKAYPMQDNGKV